MTARDQTFIGSDRFVADLRERERLRRVYLWRRLTAGLVLRQRFTPHPDIAPRYVAIVRTDRPNDCVYTRTVRWEDGEATPCGGLVRQKIASVLANYEMFDLTARYDPNPSKKKRSILWTSP